MKLIPMKVKDQDVSWKKVNFLRIITVEVENNGIKMNLNMSITEKEDINHFLAWFHYEISTAKKNNLSTVLWKKSTNQKKKQNSNKLWKFT